MVDNKSNDIDKYIAAFPIQTQKLLQQLRTIILKAAPNTTEIISYKMPAYKQNGVLIYFAAYKNHIGIYPTSKVTTVFKNELKGYKTSKGAIQLPLNKALPIGLITKIVKYRIHEDVERAQIKSKRICKNGHTYYKTSHCPTCPLCEKIQKQLIGPLSTLASPAIRALQSKKIKNLKELSKFTEKEIAALHGMGKSVMLKLNTLLKKEGLCFKDPSKK